MNRKPNFSIATYVMACLLVLVGATVAFGASAVGDKLPDLSLPDVETGKEVKVADHLMGSVGAVVFMQTSCSACRKELKALKAIGEKIPALKVVAISVDSGGASRVARYKEGLKFPFLFLHDPEFATPEIFDFAFTPALVLVGKDGKIAQLKGGFRPKDAAALEEKIAELDR